MAMKQSQNIPSDSERTVTEKMVGVEYEDLQADAESKAPIPPQKTVPKIQIPSENENVQDDAPLDVSPISVYFPSNPTGRIFGLSEELRNLVSRVPIIETPSENNGNVQGNAPLDVPPVSVCLLSNLTDRIFGLQDELRKMVYAYTKELKAKCTAAREKKVQGKVASPEACSDHPESSEMKVSSTEATDAVPNEVKVADPEAPSPIRSGELIDAVPLRYKRPDSEEILPIRNLPSEAVALQMPSLRNPEEPSSDNKVVKKKRRNSCIRFERMKVDFILPSHVDTSGLDLDNLVSPIAQLNQSPRSTRQFSFTERLLKWELEVRERDEDGKHDMYYYHGMEGYFRSIPAVTKYIMYEEYPGGKKPCKRNSRSGQFEVISLEQGSSSQPAAKRILDEKIAETSEAKVEGKRGRPKRSDQQTKVEGKRKRGRPKRSDQQTEVLSHEQGSSCKPAVSRRKKTSSEQQVDHEAATAATVPKRRRSKSHPLENNEAATRLDGTIAETLESNGHEETPIVVARILDERVTERSEPEGREAAPDIEVMLDETMARLRDTGFTPEGNTSPGDRDEEDKMLDEAIESLRKRGLATQVKNSSASSDVEDQAAAQ